LFEPIPRYWDPRSSNIDAYRPQAVVTAQSAVSPRYIIVLAEIARLGIGAGNQWYENIGTMHVNISA
jgi:hypothetical protein